MIEWIVTSSALILLVILLRVLIQGRVSPRLRYALWALVLLRLVIPGTFWESRASVMAPVAAQEVYREIRNIPSYVHTRPDGGVDVGHPSGGGWTSIPAEIASSGKPAFFDTKTGRTSTVPDAIRQVTVRNAFLLAWLAGSVLTGAFLLAVNLRFDRRLKKNRRTLEQYRGRWVFTMEGLATPCLFGLFRPGIYLTPGLEEQEKIHVLAHEYAHFRQGDHIWAALRGVCLALHWYNPLVWLAAYLSRRDCELSCDEGAVRLLGEENRADYGRTLVGLVARRTTPKDLACCATTMTGGKSALKERIALLVKHPRTTAAMAVLVAAACVGIAACTFTGAAEAEEPAETVEPAQAEADPPEGLPSLEDLPTEALDAYTLGDLYENTDPYWLLDQVEGEDIALYGVNPMGAADEVRGIYLRYGEHLQYFDQVAMPYQFIRPHLTWYDFDGDGENELLTVYTVGRGTTIDINELVVYEWEDGQWSEHRYDPAGLIEDFNANVEFKSDGDMSLISYQGCSTQVAQGGEECFLSGSVVTYNLYGKDGWGILLTLSGEIGPTLTSHNYAFDYMCDIYYNVDGTFTEGSGTLESFYEPEPDLPALEDLPTRVVSPGTPEDEASIWLLAELPDDKIAVYYEQETNRSWLRYGDVLQILNLGGRAVITPRMLLPELYFEDLDGDGEQELAMIYNSDSGTGVSVWSLTVLEWDGEVWTAHTSQVGQDILTDFNENRRVTFFPEVAATAVAYKGQNVVIDMDAMFDRAVWKDKMPVAEITGLFSEYRMENGGFTLTLTGEVRPEGYDPTTSYAFTYTCPVSYDNGAFYAGDGRLESLYPTPVSPRPDASLLTPTFREILRGFIDECRAEGMEDLSTERFAIYDVNGDGNDELITQRNNTYVAGQVERVYDGDGNVLLSEYPLVVYYSNGYATAGWSHNQGVAGDKLWPYTLLRYDAEAGKYVDVASVDGWDRSIRDTYLSYDETVIPFPADVDKDGDGFVYYIITEDGGYAPVYGEPMDYADYALWVARYQGANVIDVPYYPLTEKNIALIEQN